MMSTGFRAVPASAHQLNRHAISKEEINLLPMRAYAGVVHLVDSDEKVAAATRVLASEKVLGFDTETRPAFTKGESYAPSLVQLAASDGVYLFQLKHLTKYGPIADLLADKAVVKVGIAVDDDIRKLGGLFPLKPAGFVELALLASRVGIKNAGLRGLAALLFGFRISKQTRCSRWDASALDRAQIVYAATDAWVCREIYFALLGMPRAKRPTENRACPRKGHLPERGLSGGGGAGR